MAHLVDTIYSATEACPVLFKRMLLTQEAVECVTKEIKRLPVEAFPLDLGLQKDGLGIKCVKSK